MQKLNKRRCAGAAVDIVVEQIENRLLLSTYTVNTLSDAANPGAGLLTLRQAVADANAHSGADTIAFSPAVFAPGTQHTIKLTQGQMSFTDASGATTVTGPGSAVATVDGNAKSRLFSVAAKATVSISGLTLSGGTQTTADANANTEGGAIDNAGNLTLSNCTVSGNSVVASGTETNYYGYVTAGSGLGGAIYSTGPLTITGSLLSNNSVTNTAPVRGHVGDKISPDTGAAYGGAVYSTGPLSVADDGVSGNTLTASKAGTNLDNSDRGGPAAGGGLYGSATVTVLRSIISGNITTAGFPSGYNGSNGSDASGGGVFAGGTLLMTQCTVSGNTLQASGSSFDDGYSGVAQGGGVYAGGTATITGTNISQNSALAGNTDFPVRPSGGGGLFAASNATLTSDTISSNKLQGGPSDGTNALTSAGGGIYGGGKLTIKNTSVSDNAVNSQIPEDVTERRAGGFNVGGGIAIFAASVITGSTIDGNSATGGQGPEAYSNYDSGIGGDGAGGGVYSASTFTLTNSTIANNSAIGGKGGASDGRAAGSNGADGIGGGIYSPGILTVADSTITGNTAGAGAGGNGYNGGVADTYPAGAPGTAAGGGAALEKVTVIFVNTIISSNKALNAFNDISGSASAGSANNLIGVGGGLSNGVNGNIVGVNDPMLSVLGIHGGTTQTEVPLAGSHAIDTGKNSLVPSGITTDQRGFARISGSAVDIGATESGNSSIAGTVFNDANHNGVQDAGETGRAGVVVYNDALNKGLFEPGDATATTDSNGHYVLTMLNPGNYKIREIVPNGWSQTSPSGGLGLTIALADNTSSSGNNFGELSIAPTGGSISGTVFNDINGNGVQGSGEVGLANITVYFDANNNGRLDPVESSVLTDSNGNYQFTSLAAGSYKIREVLPPGSKQTTPTGGFGWTLTLAANQALSGKNFGEQNTAPSGASIGGMVFNDADGDGKFDNGEGGVSAWTVYIDSNNNGVLDSGEISVSTLADGSYSFTDLAAGTYILRVIRPGAWSQTTPVNNLGQHVTVSANQNKTGVLFGEKFIA